MRLCAQPELLYVDQTNFTKNPIFLTSIFLTSNNSFGDRSSGYVVYNSSFFRLGF
jgi:hypothetical protein